MALRRYVVGQLTMAQTLELVCLEALRAVGAARWVGAVLCFEGRPQTCVATDARVDEVDRVQCEARDGPALDAVRRKDVVLLDEVVRSNGRYRRFASAASEVGIASALSVPLFAPDEPVGALNLYAERPDAFSRHDVDSSLQFAAQAAMVVANARAYWDLDSLNENLVEAMSSRATIEQAKGIIMATNRCDSERAFQLLSDQSQHENVKVRELAAELVDRATNGRRPPAAPDRARP